jgi:hypothetical protein
MVDFSKFTTTKEECDLIEKIASAAMHAGVKRSKCDLYLDLECAHNDTPLRLQEMLDAASGDDAMKFSFLHDVYGIVNCLDRQTGKLGNCFVPRFAKPEKSDAVAI